MFKSMKTKEEVVMHDCPGKFLSTTKLSPTAMIMSMCCLPWCSTGTGKLDSSIMDFVFLFFFFLVLLGLSWVDVGIEKICLLLRKLNAGIVKVALLLYWLLL